MLRFLLITLLCLYSVQVIPYALDVGQIREANIRLVSQMITRVRPRLLPKKKYKIAESLSTIANKYKIDPRIVVAMVDAESEFEQSRVSPTGDISIVQINPYVWSKEFERIGLAQGLQRHFDSARDQPRNLCRRAQRGRLSTSNSRGQIGLISLFGPVKIPDSDGTKK